MLEHMGSKQLFRLEFLKTYDNICKIMTEKKQMASEKNDQNSGRKSSWISLSTFASKGANIDSNVGRLRETTFDSYEEKTYFVVP